MLPLILTLASKVCGVCALVTLNILEATFLVPDRIKLGPFGAAVSCPRSHVICPLGVELNDGDAAIAGKRQR